MKKLSWLVMTFILTGLILTACRPAVPLSPTPPLKVATPIVKADWGQKWESLLTEAKKEGKVVIYTSASGAVFHDLVRAVRDKFGIDLEVTAGRAAEITTKLFAEQKAGLFLVDMYVGGAPTMVSSVKPVGILAPLEPALLLPDVIDPQVWYGGGLFWIDTQRSILAFLAYPQNCVTINADIVRRDEIKSYNDLLNPKWKGMMTLNDPSTAGPGASLFQALTETIMGDDYVKDLAKREIIITRDERQQVEWIARGKYPIGLVAAAEIVAEFQKAGAPLVNIILAEGTYLSHMSGVLGLLNSAPHPNAAKVFINWLLTREGQTIAQKGWAVHSARLDVPTEGIDPVFLRQPNIKCYPASSEEYLLRAPAARLKAKEIFGIK